MELIFEAILLNVLLKLQDSYFYTLYYYYIFKIFIPLKKGTGHSCSQPISWDILLPLFSLVQILKILLKKMAEEKCFFLKSQLRLDRYNGLIQITNTRENNYWNIIGAGLLVHGFVIIFFCA